MSSSTAESDDVHRARSNRWLRRMASATDAPTFVLFPPAGAGPSVFRSWPRLCGDRIQLFGVCAPGREDRIGVPAGWVPGPIVEACVAAVRDVAAPGIPLVLFGHSMGALLARAVAAALPPGMVDLLVVAGTVAPDRPAPNLTQATDADVLAALSSWGGTPSAILADAVMTEVFLPVVRADFAIAEALRRPFDPDETLDVPVLALAGSHDPVAPAGEMPYWSRWTRSRFTARVIPGGHFFPVSAAVETLQVLEEMVAELSG